MQSEVCYVQGQHHEAAVSPGERYAGHRIGAYQRLSQGRRVSAVLHRACRRRARATCTSPSSSSRRSWSARDFSTPRTRSRCRYIPEKRIAIVTSSAGAAVHDMIRILRRRYPLAKVILLPVRVQGAEAPLEIAGAIRYAGKWKIGDVIITGRGGGSMEDLWAFNDERVARAIYECEIPVISAVGHEPDVTISDYVADARASTPSNAAEIAVPDQVELLRVLDSARSG